MKSFAELEAAKVVTAQELRNTLRDYANSGAAIRARVVISIIDRTSLMASDRADLSESAKKGVAVHERMHEPQKADEYQAVVDRLS